MAKRSAGTLAVPVVTVELWPPLWVQAAWWAAPARRGTPFLVPTPTGHAAAVSPEARQAGVQVGHTLTEARSRCPTVVAVPPERAVAAELWTLMLRTLTAISPTVEAAHPDVGVAYLAADGLDRLWGDTAAVARQARAALCAQGLTARVGGGPRRAVARALAQCMSDAPRVLNAEEARVFLGSLPVTQLIGAGADTLLADLVDLGLRRGADLAALPVDTVALLGGEPAVAAWRMVRLGEEPPLVPWSPPPTLAATRPLTDLLADGQRVRALLAQLCAVLGAALVERQRAAAHVTIHLTCEDGPLLARATQTPPVQTARALTAAVHALWDRMTPVTPIEGLTVRLGHLQPARIEQSGLFRSAERSVLAQRQARVTRLLQDLGGSAGPTYRLRPHPREPGHWVWEDGEP